MNCAVRLQAAKQPPRKIFTVQFFSSPAADPSGFGDGTAFQILVKTNRDGKRSFSRILIPLQTVSPVEKITATATRLVSDPGFLWQGK